MNISAKKGETVTIKFELRCFSNVDILYSDEKSRTVEIHYGLTNFIFSGCSSPSLILPTPVFCISLWPHPQTGVLFEEWVRSGQPRSPLACYQSHLGPPRSNHKTRSWHLFSFKRNWWKFPLKIDPLFNRNLQAQASHEMQNSSARLLKPI